VLHGPDKKVTRPRDGSFHAYLPGGRGLGAFSNSGSSSSAHHRLFKGSQPPSRGRHKRTTLPSRTRARSLFRLGVVIKHTPSLVQKLPAPVSGASMSVHPRPRGRGLGAFSASTSAHHRLFKSSQPPSRGRHKRTTLPSGTRAWSLFSPGSSMSAHPPPSGTRARSLFRLGDVKKDRT